MSGMGGSFDKQPALTWAEREFMALLAQQTGTADEPITDLNVVPQAFWEAIVMATDYFLIGFTRPGTREEADGWRAAWRSWEQAFVWGTDLGPFLDHPWTEYQRIVRSGVSSAREIPERAWDEILGRVRPSYRLAAVEHLLDLGGPQPAFADAVNQKAAEHYVALRLEGTRFLWSTNEEIQETVVRPAVVLLADPKFEDAQAAYLEANKRATAGDYAGAIDLAVRVVDEFLRALGCEGTGLTGRLQAAEKKGLKAPVVGVLNQLSGLRAGEDTAASPGPAEAMLALHLAASVCQYLKTVAP